MKSTHKQFLYSKTQEPRVFDEDEDIPAGWYDSPDTDNHRTNKMWDDESAVEAVIDDARQDEAKEAPKYPSQMNKAELIQLGRELDLSLDNDMTKKEMLDAVNAAIRAAK